MELGERHFRISKSIPIATRARMTYGSGATDDAVWDEGGGVGGGTTISARTSSAERSVIGSDGDELMDILSTHHRVSMLGIPTLDGI